MAVRYFEEEPLARRRDQTRRHEHASFVILAVGVATLLAVVAFHLPDRAAPKPEPILQSPVAAPILPAPAVAPSTTLQPVTVTAKRDALPGLYGPRTQQVDP